MTTLFFLFLLHASVGLLAMLPFVPVHAGAKFFKFCSATAAFMSTAGLGLLLRRYGLQGTKGAPGGEHYLALIVACAGLLVFGTLYNRAEHFGWRARNGLLGLTLAAGVAATLLAARPGPTLLQAASDVTSAWLIGATTVAMILGHWYLVVLDLSITALRRMTIALIVGLFLRALVVGFVLFGPHTGWQQAGAVASGLFNLDGVFVWMRLLFGLVGPLALIGFVWKTVEMRSTQSATGILYIELFLVMAGELLAKNLRLTAGLPL